MDDFDNDNDWQKRENKLSDEAKYHRKNDKKKEKRSDVSSKTKINKSEKNDENREDGEISDDDDDIVDQRRDFKYKDRYKKCKDGHSIVEISDTSNSSNDSEESDKLQGELNNVQLTRFYPLNLINSFYCTSYSHIY